MKGIYEEKACSMNTFWDSKGNDGVSEIAPLRKILLIVSFNHSAKIDPSLLSAEAKI